MHYDEFDEFGRCVRREVVVEKVFDDLTGDERTFEVVRETIESFDGSAETYEVTGSSLTDCGHAHRLGDRISRCNDCTKEKGRTVFVCAHCAVLCPYCGQATCLRHSKPHSDGHRYCLVCTKKRRFLPAPSTEKPGRGIILWLFFGFFWVLGLLFSLIGRILKALFMGR